VNTNLLKDRLRGSCIFPEPTANSVHHYTTIRGLHGILSSFQLWATDVSYMNDTSEYAYAERLIEQTTRALNPPLFLDPVLHALWHNPRSQGIQVYAACFCGKPDLLSQWRAYSGEGTGYAIEFNWQKLAQRVGAADVFFGKVEYSESVQGELIRAIVLPHLKAVSSQKEIHQAAIRDPADSPFAEVLHLLAVVRAFRKSSSFSEEQEWRMVIMGPTTTVGPNFRPEGDILVPHIPMDLGGSREMSPFGSITVGPGSRRAQAQDSLRRFLASRGLDWIDVKGSLVPVRL
jgi:hypothetical protein